MVFEHIENLKREYTDKYVVVDNERPELRRFDGQTGIVRTVNMNGRALVEFDAYDNIGWFDIDVDFLKIIDKPLPKPEAKATKKKAAPTAKKAEKKPATGGTGMSVAEMMAAARGEKGGGAKPAAPKSDPAPQAAPSKAAASGAAGMSVAEMMAAARAEKSTAAAAPEPVAEEAAPAEPAAPAAEEPAPPPGDLPTDTASVVAYCRKVDGS